MEIYFCDTCGEPFTFNEEEVEDLLLNVLEDTVNSQYWLSITSQADLVKDYFLLGRKYCSADRTEPGRELFSRHFMRRPKDMERRDL